MSGPSLGTGIPGLVTIAFPVMTSAIGAGLHFYAGISGSAVMVMAVGGVTASGMVGLARAIAPHLPRILTAWTVSHICRSAIKGKISIEEGAYLVGYFSPGAAAAPQMFAPPVQAREAVQAAGWARERKRRPHTGHHRRVPERLR